jgi:hypothetical protein
LNRYAVPPMLEEFRWYASCQVCKFGRAVPNLTAS